MASENSKNVLQLEFNWLLTEEVSYILQQLKSILHSCLQKFEIPTVDTLADAQQGNNFLLSLPNSDAVKGIISIVGDSVTKAELKFKFPKFGHSGIGTFIFEQCPWKLQQLQEAQNNLRTALEEIHDREACEKFTSGEEVEELLNCLMAGMNRAKKCMLVPEKASLSSLMNSSLQRVLNPAVPEELVISFTVNCDKLVLSVYVLNQITTLHSSKTNTVEPVVGHQFGCNGKYFEVINKAEIICTVPWLKDLIVWVNSAQQLCQQLKDKISIFHTLLPDLQVREENHVVVN